MQRTICLKLLTTSEHVTRLRNVQQKVAAVCNQVVPVATKHRCRNNIALHHQCYRAVRASLPELGSQMVCNAIKSVAASYKTLLVNRPKLEQADWPPIHFRDSGSVHYDKRTYSFDKNGKLSLYTLQGRIKVEFALSENDRALFDQHPAKEAKLCCRNGQFFFHLTLDLPDSEPMPFNGLVLGVDVGENKLAATSSGKLFGGEHLRDARDKFLALRRRLQRNGTQSAKQRLCKVSSKEQRHVKHINHEISKAIVQEALDSGCTAIALEDLTHIRKRIKTGKRVRARLHRWAFRQLQTFVEYKAQAAGLWVEYVNPAYSSQTCAACGCLGTRQKHRFTCSSCGNVAHSDCNAGQNLAMSALSALGAAAVVTQPHVVA